MKWLIRGAVLISMLRGIRIPIAHTFTTLPGLAK